MPQARTPIHQWHAARGAHFADQDGWLAVAAYSDPEREAEAARTGLGLADVSAFAKIGLRGLGVSSFASSLVPDSAAVRPRGVASLPGEPALACRLTEDHLLLLATTPTATSLGQRIAVLREGRPIIQVDSTSAYAGFALVGPRLEKFLLRLTHLDLLPASFPVNSCSETALAGVEALLVRTGEFSLPALRIYVGWDLGEYVWERLLEAGRDESITPIGLEALRLLGRQAQTTD
jgi:sarcosine oxidase subunit alpha